MAMVGAIQALTASQARQLATTFQLLQAGQAAAALTSAAQLAALAPAAPDAQQLLAMCLAETGAVDNAETAFRCALALAPRHPLILLNYATLLRKLGRLDEALAGFQDAVGSAPELAKAWLELGLTALQAGRSQRALTALGRAVELTPDSALAWHALGNARRETSDLEAAAEAFQTAVAIAPDYATAWVNLGVVRRLLGRADEALRCFEQADRLGYASAELSDAWTGALLDSGELALALQRAQELTETQPAFVPGHLTLAHLRWEYGATAKQNTALSEFRDAVEQQPQHRPLRRAFAQFLLAARCGEEVLREVRVLRADGDDPQLTLMEAEALDLLADNARAGQVFRHLQGLLGSTDVVFLNAYTRFLLRTGEWAAAAQQAEAATRLDPANQEAWAYLGTAWRLLDDAREHWLCDYQQWVGEVAIEPPPGFASMAAFLVALKATLEPMHQATRAPVQQSVRGGSQTPGRLFGRNDPLIAATQVALRRGIEDWLKTLPNDPQHPFLRRTARTVRVIGSWSVRLWSAGNHVNHIHPEGWLSSAFYVDLPTAVTRPNCLHEQAGCLQFGQPPQELGLNLPPRRVVRPKAGSLALFPSYFWHGTVPFEDTQARLTIAFDMAPKH